MITLAYNKVLVDKYCSFYASSPVPGTGLASSGLPKGKVIVGISLV